MKLTLIDQIVCADYDTSDFEKEKEIVGRISGNTEETWQPDRKAAERYKNTRQGKIAEEIVETYFKRRFSHEIDMVTYDTVRNDGWEKHAPFDFLFWEKGKADIAPVIQSVRQDIQRTPNQFVHLSQHTRDLCRENHVKVAEVKSTSIRPALKEQAGFHGNYGDEGQVRKLLHVILQTDDIFCYPFYKRSAPAGAYTMQDYCEYVKRQEPSLAGLSGKQLERAVLGQEIKKQCCDVFIRVYLDENAHRGFVLGWMQRERLLDQAVTLKRMVQKGKSEKALYFARSLKETEWMDQIPAVFGNGFRVYASEAEAIAGRRFTRRCLKCF